MSSRHRFALAPFALVAILAQGQAHAQDYNPGVPPGYMQQAPSDANVLGDPSAMAADPPSRIATVTDMAGGLSFAPAGADEWAALGPNRPITTGDRLWVDPGGRAELHAGTTAVRLGGGTAVAILNLDDRTTQVKLTQGTLQLRVRALPQDQQVEIDTPNLAFVPREPGDYRIDVSPDGTTTLVTMRHGSAVLYGDTRSIELERGQRMRFAGTDLADAGAGSYPAPDSFDQWTAMRDAREDASVSARYVPPGMTGYTALDDYGDWQQDAGYGAVWFPRAMPAGWAPYSVGRWAWVAPWGWTWIDDAPWGFAPAHYGRWAHFGNRWGWVPGPRGGQPCYAPAVVGFIGGAGTTIRIGTGPGVAWYPLGPRDAYRPVYRASPGYVNRINYHAVNNGWIRGGDRDRGRWANREVPGAISGMPSRNFVEGRPVPRGSYRDEWRHLPVGEGRGAPPMAPVKNSLIGGARPHGLPPMARDGFERQAIAAHPPGRVGPDELARRFAREGGTAGAGPAWRGPVPDGRRQDAGSQRRGPQPVQGWQPDVRMSQAAPDRRFSGQRPDDGQRQQQAMQRQQFEQQRQLQDQQRQAADFRQQQQQAMQRQRDDQQRELQNQQRQGYEQQRRMQFDQQRMEQEQRRQLDDQRRDAMNRQQFDQQRQQQERQQQDMQRQAQQRQQQFDQQRQQQERQQQDMQRQAQQRQQQFDQQRQQQERQQQDMQRQQQQQQRQQLEQARQFQEQQRQQFEQQRQHALQRQQMEQQQRQAQEQQRRFQEQQQQQQHQQQQQQRQAQEQQRQFQEQQRQQQDRQRQFQQQQQQQQQRAQHERGRDQQARNNDGR